MDFRLGYALGAAGSAIGVVGSARSSLRNSSKMAALKVALAKAGNDGEDQLARVLRALGHLDSGTNSGSGRDDSNQQTFFFWQASGVIDRLIIGDMENVTDHPNPLTVNNVTDSPYSNFERARDYRKASHHIGSK